MWLGLLTVWHPGLGSEGPHRVRLMSKIQESRWKPHWPWQPQKSWSVTSAICAAWRLDWRWAARSSRVWGGWSKLSRRWWGLSRLETGRRWGDTGVFWNEKVEPTGQCEGLFYVEGEERSWVEAKCLSRWLRWERLGSLWEVNTLFGHVKFKTSKKVEWGSYIHHQH